LALSVKKSTAARIAVTTAIHEALKTNKILINQIVINKIKSIPSASLQPLMNALKKIIETSHIKLCGSDL